MKSCFFEYTRFMPERYKNIQVNLKMPYADNYFDTVLLVSILEHLKPLELAQAFVEVNRVLKFK